MPPRQARRSGQKLWVLNASTVGQTATVVISLFFPRCRQLQHQLGLRHDVHARVGPVYLRYHHAECGDKPGLWSPSSPYMYSLRTLVKVGGVVVDSVVEPCGVRWFSWTTLGFNLNGSRLELKGMCLHQGMGWIKDAVPEAPYIDEIKVLKNMGCNSVRCSHYPLRPAGFL